MTHQIKVDETLYEYLPKGEFTYYQMSFADNNTNITDSFTLKMSVFTGNIEVGIYYDKDFKKEYEKVPHQYMSDMQFNFKMNDFEKGTQ
jgi:small-conductance mechanosensitive channel